jgi:hypothetical protein
MSSILISPLRRALTAAGHAIDRLVSRPEHVPSPEWYRFPPF